MTKKATAIWSIHREKRFLEGNKGVNNVYSVYPVYCLYTICTRIAPGVCILSKIGIEPATWRITVQYLLGIKMDKHKYSLVLIRFE